MWMLEKPIQKLDTYTCGSFQPFFFENLFNHLKRVKCKMTKSDKKAIQTLLNQLFTTNKNENEEIMQKLYARKTNKT